MYDTAEIKERIDLAALVEERVTLRRSGTALLGMCPFHENTRTPALAVFPATGTWKCFGCGKGGDCFAWWMELHQVDFKVALEELGRRAGMNHEKHENHERESTPKLECTPKGPGEAWVRRGMDFLEYCRQQLQGERGGPAREYLEKERGLWPETWGEFGLGYNPDTIYDEGASWGLEDGRKVWLPRGMVIPGMVRGGAPWYVKIRRPRPKDSLAGYIGVLTARECITDHGRLNPNDDPKFGGPRGGQATLFTHGGKSSHAVMVLVEGEWDTMLAWQWGNDLADWGTLGAAGNRADIMDLGRLARYAAMGVVMDDDLAGEKARRYWAKLEVMQERLTVIPPPDHDLTDFWKGKNNLRAWLAKQAAGLLEKAIGGADGGVPEGWKRAWEWAVSESQGPSF